MNRLQQSNKNWKGLWVLLDGSLWPITAVDVVKLHEKHRTEVPKRSWQPCPCRISSRQVGRNEMGDKSPGSVVSLWRFQSWWILNDLRENQIFLKCWQKSSETTLEVIAKQWLRHDAWPTGANTTKQAGSECGPHSLLAYTARLDENASPATTWRV